MKLSIITWIIVLAMAECCIIEEGKGNCSRREQTSGGDWCPSGYSPVLVRTESQIVYTAACNTYSQDCRLDSLTQPCKDGCWYEGCEEVVTYYYECQSTGSGGGGGGGPRPVIDPCSNGNCSGPWNCDGRRLDGSFNLDQICDEEVVVPSPNPSGGSASYMRCRHNGMMYSCSTGTGCKGRGGCSSRHNCSGLSCRVSAIYPCYCSGVGLCYCVDNASWCY